VNHAGHPQLRELGDPTNSTIYKDEEGAAFRRVEDHVVRGATQLLPGDVRDLRDHLVGTHLKQYQIYTMILVGIKLFLRAEELLSLRIEMFDKTLSVVNADEVRAVAIWIKGKSDKSKKGLYIFEDERCPEFCPLRHLLVYLSLMGIKSGYLFPHISGSIYEGTHGSTRWAYGAWRNKLRSLISNHCGTKRRVDIKLLRVGTHTLRKTGYLFAVWGTLKFNGHVSGSTVGIKSTADIQFSNILLSARHSSISNAAGYIRDSATTLALQSKESFSTQHTVGYWESIHIDNYMSGQSITSYSHMYQKDVHELAQYYITTKYKVPTDGTMSIKTVLNVVLAVRPTTDLLSSLCKKFEQDCAPSKCSEYTLLLDLVIKQVSNEVRASALDYVDLPDSIKDTVRQHLKRKQEESVPVSTKKPKKKPTTGLMVVPVSTAATQDDLPPLAYYNNTLPARDQDKSENIRQYRETYKDSKNTIVRVQALLECEKYLVATYPDGKLLNLVEPARQFYQRYVRQLVYCVDCCHNGSSVDCCTAINTLYGKKLFRADKYSCSNCTTTKLAGSTNVSTVQSITP
jgi:hypothetical protein